MADIVFILRSPLGCPWDRKQKPSNYKDYLVEEVYELIEAINKGKKEDIEEELGDVLLLVVMLAQIYSESGRFKMEDVISRVCGKLIARHPHVFGNKKASGSEEVLANWVKQKAKEKKRNNFYERVPKAAPSLIKAMILFKEMKHHSILGDFIKKIGINRDILGNELLCLAMFSSKEGVNPEEALSEAVEKAALNLSYDGAPGKKDK